MSPINMNRNPGSPVIIEGYDLSATIGDHLGWKLTGYKWEDGINAKVVTENLSSMRIVDGREYGFDDGQVLVELRSDKTEKGCYWGALQAIKIG
jgi:hypothetical protein